MGSDTEGGSALRADGGCFESAILAKPTVALIGVIEPKGNYRISRVSMFQHFRYENLGSIEFITFG